VVKVFEFRVSDLGLGFRLGLLYFFDGKWTFGEASGPVVVVVEMIVGWSGEDICLGGRRTQFDGGDGRGVGLSWRR
jgi:hypothetical protein